MTVPLFSNWVLGPLLGLFTLLFIGRIILSWYPQANLNQFPFLLAAWPTEPFLLPLRKLVPPIGGIDITPIIWVGIISLIRELLLGQQGLLRMLT
jgi:YggT family protein